ncbi:DEAD/DEAH box helicase [Archaeoglobus profundus]|uniref:DEAD/DEAH box helicase domain protein n=1 Tax=Archaeoglobus profundus (strain DSM 5631 / JCM 9629 / NBRC 100127 / Av18) TaxID=572546 RepID=D2RG69_ARCPA|nr:DEAD/DEAH box helicase [Archaeoglobus profundus]ADB57294.1 DEAD/DEAH box helicase domain protein [Archaeoglobus profundus DSM 5631]
MEYVHHPLIRENTIERRSYQIAITATALMRNTLVVLPTGLGKTVIALLVIASRLHNKGGKALVLAPTKPLVEQHANFFRKTLKIPSNEIVALSGEVPPDKRYQLWNKAKVVVSTPQVIENDLISGRISLEDVVHVTFDEAHRAVGNYSYVFIAKAYMEQAKDPLILAITASPGSDIERIEEVIKNLYIEDVEVRTELDEDVKPYIHERAIEWVRVEMPKELKEVRDLLNECVELRLMRLEGLGVKARGLSKKELLALQEALQSEAYESGDQRLFEALSVLAEILKIHHAIELIETQGLDALKHYLRRIVVEAKSRGGSRASKSIIADPKFKKAVVKALKCEVDHPKLEKLKEIVSSQLKEKPESRIIVFTNFRDTAEVISRELQSMGVPAVRFVGQANRENDRGLRQREQVEIVERFRAGDIKVLVATSVGEEGLDIPEVDLVVFYEAIPSEIRSIQRKGRTGRKKEGRIVVLVTKGTRDEAYFYISLRKERAMFERLRDLKFMLKRTQKSLEEFKVGNLKDVTVYVDSREMRSEVVKKLYEKANVRVGNFNADYVVSDRVAIERKTADDFVDSIIDRRLFDQLIELKKHYLKPVLIVEGDGIYRRLNPNAIRGALATVIVDFGIPVIFTKSPEETAEFIVSLARREQLAKDREVSPHYGKTKMTLKEQMEYVVSSISDIGPVIARNLLEHFQTIENIAKASVEDLMKVPKVGKKTAEKIVRIMKTPYSEADKFVE